MPGSIGKEPENCSLFSMPRWVGARFVFESSNDEFAVDEVGDSGEELGDGSVSDDSTVDIVVVGEESVDSNVDVESRRR